jgi:hypothetical protein
MKHNIDKSLNILTSPPQTSINHCQGFLPDTADDDPLSVLQGHSITYRIALGPQAGRKVFTLQTVPPVDIDETAAGTVGQVGGFNRHAGVAVRADQRHKLERLCRYISRPAVSEQRLSLTAQGKVRCRTRPFA